MWGLLALLFGLLYGWLKPGRQNKMGMLKTGILVGLIVGVVLGLIGLAVRSNPLGFGTDVLSIFISILVVTLLFILGVWLGDLIEGRSKRTA